MIIPKSETLKHIQNNLQLSAFKLRKDDMGVIDRLDKGLRFGGNPDTTLEEHAGVKVPV